MGSSYVTAHFSDTVAAALHISDYIISERYTVHTLTAQSLAPTFDTTETNYKRKECEEIM